MLKLSTTDGIFVYENYNLFIDAKAEKLIFNPNTLRSFNDYLLDSTQILNAIANKDVHISVTLEYEKIYNYYLFVYGEERIKQMSIEGLERNYLIDTYNQYANPKNYKYTIEFYSKVYKKHTKRFKTKNGAELFIREQKELGREAYHKRSASFQY